MATLTHGTRLSCGTLWEETTLSDVHTLVLSNLQRNGLSPEPGYGPDYGDAHSGPITPFYSLSRLLMPAKIQKEEMKSGRLQ